jgi:hypothetical protein
MTFLAPLWLVLVIPCGALAAWLLWTRYSGTGVPFLELWRGAAATPARGTRRLRLPPLSLLALSAAMLLAALAAARPAVNRAAVKGPTTNATTSASAPVNRPVNIGITHVAAVERPRPQVMVSVRNDSAGFAAGALEIQSGGHRARQDIALPSRGREANFFIDLPALADTVQVELRPSDDFPADNAATLTRSSTSARVEIRGDVPPEVRRVAEAYNRVRPAVGERGGRIVAIPPTRDEPGIFLADGAASATVNAGAAQVVDHPVTAKVDFARASVAPIASATSPNGGGWTPLVTLDGRAIVAARESPARQVWIGFAARDFARTPGFVVFCTNAIEWVSGAGDAQFAGSFVPYTAEPPAKDQAAGQPEPMTRIELAPFLACAGVFCVFFAALAWPAARRPAHA